MKYSSILTYFDHTDISRFNHLMFASRSKTIEYAENLYYRLFTNKHPNNESDFLKSQYDDILQKMILMGMI